MIRRKDTLFNQGLGCITMLFVGIANAPFIPRHLRMKLLPFMILSCFLVLFFYQRHKEKHGKEGIEREQRDERAQMLLERSVWYSRQVEDWLLLALFAILGLYVQKYEIAYTLYWFMLGRCLLTFAIRWWLNRNY